MELDATARVTETESIGAVFTRVRSGRTPMISVVVPAMTEAKNLPHVLPLIPSWIDEVILVDGNSTDVTVAVAR